MLLSALVNRVKEQIVLQRKINEAQKHGKYLITITYQKQKDSKNLEHFWTMKKFPIHAVLHALSFLYKEIDEKELVFHDLLREEKGGTAK
jgi:hypothetical protein